MTALNAHQETALRLLARGFVVMLAGRGSKVPLAKNWQQTPRPTEAQVYAMWSGPTPANVSVLTGEPSGIFVLDIDPGAGGFESMQALTQQHGPLPDTYITQTGSGGYHYYFQMPDWDMRNTKSKLAPGIDTRANGGQVIAPPSISEKGPYREVGNANAPIAKAPAWMLEALRPKEAAPLVVSSAPAATPEQTGAYEGSIIEGELGRLDALDRPWHEGAGWDETTFQVACTLTQLANSPWSSLTHEDVERLLHERAPHDEAWGDGEIQLKITSARNRVGDKQREAPTSGAVDIFAGVPYRRSVDQTTPWVKHSWDDFGNAERVVALHGRELLWVPELGKWAVFLDGRWIDFAEGGERAAMDTIGRLGDLEASLYSDVKAPPKNGKGEPKSQRDDFLKWVADQRYAARAKAAATAVRYTGALNVAASAFDQHPELLNVRNGVVDLLSGALRPHSPDLLLRLQSPVDYDPAATAPTWEAFLARVQPDPEMRNYLQRIIGYTITGHREEHAFFLHRGETQSGKSVFLEVMEAVLGEYAQTVPADTLMAKKQQQHPADIARMQGKRMLQLSETEEGARFDQALMKRLAGGDTITARGMGQEFREFKMTGKAHVVTNFEPHINHDPAVHRRLHYVRWGVQIPEQDRDRSLPARIKAAELPGVLAWAVRGTQEWKRHGLAAPVQAVMDRETYIAIEDEFGKWLEERTVASHTMTTTDSLYRGYAAWAEGGNLKPMNVVTFGRELKKRGVEAGRTTHARGWMIALRDPTIATFLG